LLAKECLVGLIKIKRETVMFDIYFTLVAVLPTVIMLIVYYRSGL